MPQICHGLTTRRRDNTEKTREKRAKRLVSQRPLNLARLPIPPFPRVNVGCHWQRQCYTVETWVPLALPVFGHRFNECTGQAFGTAALAKPVAPEKPCTIIGNQGSKPEVLAF
jgi:hypothetical protein